MNDSDVRAFSKVALTGSFSRAAEQLGLTRSTVSKSVSRLEEDLGVVLLRRSTQGVSLTAEGRIFYEHAIESEETMARAVASISGAGQRPAGHISCTLPTSFGAALLPLFKRDFRKAWPEITYNLDFDERFADIVLGHYDVGIRISDKLRDLNLLARCIGTTRRVLVASPGYLAEFGTPSHVSELSSHRCLGVGGSTRSRRTWRFGGADHPIEVSVVCSGTANKEVPLILLACMGDGILYVPEICVGGELARDQLQEILPEFCEEQILNIYAVHPYHKQLPAKVKAFIDFVEQSLPELKSVDRWSPLADYKGNTRT